MPAAVLIFALGSKWVLQNVRILQAYRELWPVFSVAMAVAWLIHLGQFEEFATNTWLGADFGVATIEVNAFLLRISGINAQVQGQVLRMPPPSMVPAVGVTPLCGGFLSFLMFTVAFGIVLFDVGRQLGKVRLLGVFVLGAVATMIISILRVYIVLVLGFYWGFNVMMTAHTYLGYALFLAFISLFWYFTLRWSKRPMGGAPAALSRPQMGHSQG
jgi:exosortase/archaeosortase family protein